MIILVAISLVISLVASAPGYDFNDIDLYHPPIVKAAPLLAEPFHLPSAPIYAPAPILKASPIYAPAPIIKTIAAPVLKTVVPAATSYASITQYHAVHPAPVVKTVVAPAPILKSYVAEPLSYGHSYH
ncbi:hypothetical protein JTB14_003647 [Gonioctena quinquepunctata]|nr:hypothetical protein JTB14_003647 [Gonioctena quinquepunctata]